MYELDLSIIVLNWNTARLLDRCLESLIKNTPDVTYEIFIVDNNSKGDSFNKVEDKYRQNANFHWIKNSENIGGIANNRILPLCRGRYIALIGNDILVLPGCFRNLIDFLDKQEDAGAVSAKQLNPDGSALNYYSRFHDLPMYFWRATLLGSALDKIFFKGKRAGYYWYSDIDPNKLTVVDQPPAPCFIMRRADFIRDYITDERIPLFFGDVDLCRRIYKGGYKIYVLPSAEIVHFPGSSFKKADPGWVDQEYRRSLIYYFEKYYPRQVLLLKFLLFADSLPQSMYKWVGNLKVNFLRNELADCDSILDLGCGPDSPIQYINTAYSVGVELHEPYLLQSEEKALHTEYIKSDIREVVFKDKSFDGVMMLEVLDHLTREEGKEMIDKMQRWARKKVVITVPNGNVRKKTNANNGRQEHKSQWSVSELTSMDFKVRGFGGWKILHGEKGEVKFKPKTLWKAVSFLALPIVYRLPWLAFLLGAVKKTN